MAGSFNASFNNSMLPKQVIFQNQGDPYEELRKALGGGGLFGLGDLATGGLFSMGGSLLGGLASLFGGDSPTEKRAKETYNLAKNRMGQNVIEPEQYLADYKRAMMPEMNRSAEKINTRMGLDSGAAQSQLLYDMQAPLASFLLNAKMKNDVLKSQNDNMLMQLMASLGGSR